MARSLRAAAVLALVALSLVAGGQAAAADAYGGETSVVDLPSTGELLLDVSWKLGLVLLLAWGALWLVRRGVKVRMGAGGRRLEVLETVGLGGQRCLHLVRAGDRVLLVGSTPQQLTALSDLGEWDPAQEAQYAAEAQPATARPLGAPSAVAAQAATLARRLWSPAVTGE